MGDTGGLRRLAAEVTDAGHAVDRGTGKITGAVGDVTSSAAGPEARAAHVFAGRWDTVGATLRTITSHAGTLADALGVVAQRLDAAAADWSDAISAAYGQGAVVTTSAAGVIVTAPTGATPATVSACAAAQSTADAAVRSASTARSAALATVTSIQLSDVDDLADGATARAAADTGDAELDTAIDRIAAVILAVPQHFQSAAH